MYKKEEEEKTNDRCREGPIRFFLSFFADKNGESEKCTRAAAAPQVRCKATEETGMNTASKSEKNYTGSDLSFAIL